ncbi:DUF2099 family protein [Methanomicrobium antiquum]|uniref:DUF2099 family protein n=1 Tax=Methanomicrobium antiquum TaxID=487686 RepID=A0AAF0FNE4_9EURY|nr:methanogenesis marker 8 protein [Methanomicrobium antiquum]WFN35774.1 DUF2099 family protein [Methanomicrobium antiquum]
MSLIDEHIIEAAGKTQVVIRNGKVISVGKPVITNCPLARRFNYPVNNMEPEEIKKNIEERISSFGMCTKEREVLSDDDFVLFGASELLSSAISGGIIDCAVIACDGAGTVIAQNPRLVQGIGGKMSGLVQTCPYPEVICRINNNLGYTVFPNDASIDSYKGYLKAVELGFLNIAVTVTSGEEALRLRKTDENAFIVAVHTTNADIHESELLAENCDIISACASKHLREIAGKRALLQGGVSVPVYAMTKKGKEVILEKIKNTKNQVLIKGGKLPFSAGKDPSPLV